MDDENKAYGWDDKVPEAEGGEFTLLPDGVYPFRVLKIERSTFNGSPKMSACPVAIAHLQVGDCNTGTTTIRERLFLHSKFKATLCRFFGAIKLRKKGDGEWSMNWAAVPGCDGYCKVGTRTHEGKTYNEVKTFIYPEELDDSVLQGTASGQQNAEPEPWE